MIPNLIDSSAAMDARAREDYPTILSNPDHFYALFCRAISSTVPKNHDFYVSRKDNATLAIRGNDYSIQNVRRSVECIIVLLERGYREQRAVAVLGIRTLLNDLFIREQSPTSIDLSDWNSPTRTTVAESTFKSIIVPVIQKFSKSIGATCVQSRVSQRVDEGQERFKDRFCPKFLIDWERVSNSPTCSIIPKSVKLNRVLRVELNRILYDMQAAGKLCDFTLTPRDGTPIKAHSLILRLYGGPDFQNVEPGESMHFEQCSARKLQKVVKRLYMGKKNDWAN